MDSKAEFNGNFREDARTYVKTHHKTNFKANFKAVLRKGRGILSVSALLGVCMLAGCGGNAASESRNAALLSAMPGSDIGTGWDSSAVEIPGSVDYSVYEAYGLSYDEEAGCYTYGGNIVRFFNDPAAGAGFTNFFTGTVDIEAERDADNRLIGIRECSREAYDRHTQKHERFQGMPAGAQPDAARQAGTGQGSAEWLKEYEDYGVSYDMQDGSWRYGDEKIKLLIDAGRASVYSTDETGVCLVACRDGSNSITELKTVSESEAQSLLRANKPEAAGGFTVEETEQAGDKRR